MCTLHHQQRSKRVVGKFNGLSVVYILSAQCTYAECVMLNKVYNFRLFFFFLEFIYAQIFLTTDCRCVKILNLFKLHWKINIYSLTVKTTRLQQSIQPSIFEVG